jgi:hypothetical protein
MIAHHIGVQGGISRSRLPADVYPALLGYSLNRKLRSKYTGEYFKFRHAGGTGKYPTDTPDLSGSVYIEKIYDQKSKHGVPVQDAVQSDLNLQPRLAYVAGKYQAIFNDHEYLNVLNLAPLIGQDFTIITLGGATRNTPMIGIWGNNSEVTIEPSDVLARFTFDNDMGVMMVNSKDEPMSYFSGLSDRQNSRIIGITSSSEVGLSRDSETPSFTNIAIGKSRNRKFSGYFTEATMHLGELTENGRKQALQSTRNHYI